MTSVANERSKAGSTRADQSRSAGPAIDGFDDRPDDIEVIAGSIQPKHFKQWRAEFFSTFRWLVSGMVQLHGAVRMLSISFMAFLGSVAMSIMSFAIIFIIRSASPSDDNSFRGLPIPDWPLSVMLSALLIGGTSGAFIFYMSERRAATVAVEFGDHLRKEALSSLNRPLSRGWQAAFEGKPQQVLTQVLVSGIRDITMAAREIVRVIGPSSMFVATVALLFVLEPEITGMIVPMAVLFAIPVYLINRRVERLNDEFEINREEASADLKLSIDELLEGGYSETVERLRTSALAGDHVTHERTLEPVRIRALSTVLTSFFAAAVLGLFVLRADGEDLNFIRLIIYVIVLRLCANSAQKLAGVLTNITRRGVAIDRYRQFQADLQAHREQRIERLDADEVPAELLFAPKIGTNVAIGKGETIVVLVPRPPKRSTLDLLLLSLERHFETGGVEVDLLGGAEVVLEDELFDEEHVVGKATMARSGRTLRLVATTDVEAAALTSGGKQNIVVTHAAGKSWSTHLDGWEHLVVGVMVVVDDEVVCGGPLHWVRANRELILEKLGREPASPGKANSPKGSG